jgi:hypothetical protein
MLNIFKSGLIVVFCFYSTASISADLRLAPKTTQKSTRTIKPVIIKKAASIKPLTITQPTIVKPAIIKQPAPTIAPTIIKRPSTVISPIAVQPPQIIKQPVIPVAKPVITGFDTKYCAKKGDSIIIYGTDFGSKKGAALGGNGINVTLKISTWAATQITAYIPNDSRIISTKRYYIGINNPATKNWLSNISKSVVICEPPKRAPLITAAINPVAKIPTITSIPPRTTTPTPRPAPTPAPTPPAGAPTTPPVAPAIIEPAPAPIKIIPPPTPAPTRASDAEKEKPQSPKKQIASVNISTEAPAPFIAAPENNENDFQDNESFPESFQQDNFEDSEEEFQTQTVLPNSFGSLMDRQLPPPPPNLASTLQATDSKILKHAEPNELIVISSNMQEARKLSQQLGGYGLSAKKRKILKSLGLVITTFRVPSDVDSQQMAIDVRQAYPEMWADINHRYKLLANNRDTQIAKKIINWNKSTAQCGKGLRIGLLDTAIDTTHPALIKQKITTHSVISHGIKKAKTDHGTAIATLLVGTRHAKSFSGMMPSAKLYSAAVFRQRDKHNIDTTAEWIVSAIDWLLSQKVHVINMSIGGPRNLLVDVALQRTIKSGIPVIAAAGNNGSSAVPVYPAAQPGVIAVTAVDSDMEIYDEANHGKYIDFSAPGVDIWSANAKGKGKFVSGTSFSAPFVTASMASIIKKLGPRKAYAHLQKTAKDLGTQGKDSEFGWGLIQAPKSCK